MIALIQPRGQEKIIAGGGVNYLQTTGKRLRALRALRDDLGMTAEQVLQACERAGVPISKSAYNRYELDEALPQSDRLAVLAKVLGTSTEYLSMSIDNPMPLVDMEGSNGEAERLCQKIAVLSPRDQQLITALVDAMQARYS